MSNFSLSMIPMKKFKLHLVEKNYIEVEIEANTIEEAKEKAFLQYPSYEDDKNRVAVEVYDLEWNEQ
jgi:hypothetical protein